MKPEEGKAIVTGIVEQWSKIYIKQVFFKSEANNILQYYVEFSKPSKDKPIPEGVVNVFFDIILGEGQEYDIEFSFESESLKHKLGATEADNKTLRNKDMFQSWIDRVLENKFKIK